MNAIISTDVDNIEELKKTIGKVPDMNGLELASKCLQKNLIFMGMKMQPIKFLLLDIGIKKNILRNFAKRDAYIKVFPYNASFEELSAFKPDGYFISNGPGDPEPLVDAQNTSKRNH